jgi:hypothetical protein
VTHGPEDTHSELAALADGTLQDEQREQLLALVADSPELAAELERQRRALALMGALEQVQAPAALRRSVEALAAGEDVPASPRAASVHLPREARTRHLGRLWLVAGVALAAVVAIVVAVVVSSGSSTGGGAAPTVLQASGAGVQPATRPAPAESAHDGRVLAASAVGLSFPYWEARPLRWRATGARVDTVGGRTVTTVFYGDRAGRRIGYSIVSGAALPVPAGSGAVQRGGLTFHVLRSGHTTVVTWREAGHTCILTARGVAPETLERLAAWQRA